MLRKRVWIRSHMIEIVAPLVLLLEVTLWLGNSLMPIPVGSWYSVRIMQRAPQM